MQEGILIQCRHCGKPNRVEPSKAWGRLQALHCGSCAKELAVDRYETLTGLQPKHYQHPLDQRARRALNTLPGIDTLLKTLLREGLVKYHHLLLRQNAVEVHPGHLGRVHRFLVHSAQTLGISPLPSLYVQQSPLVNAYTYGAGEHVIVITTALVDLLEEDELETVIAHELGHIHCDHVLYKTAARLLSTIAVEAASRMFGLASSLIYPLIYGLLYWDRTSELSADRAELLVNQDYKTSVRTMLKIAGGSRKLAAELDVDQFLAQARKTQELTENNILEKIYHIIQESNSTHHFPIWRAQKLEEWGQSPQLLSLLCRNFPGANSGNPEDPGEDGNTSSQEISWKDITSEFRNIFGF